MDRQSDYAGFTHELTILAEGLGASLSAAQIEAYYRVLERFAYADVARALNTALREDRFFPKPVELRHRIEGNPVERAARAWELLVEAVAQSDCYYSLWVEDHAFAHAIRRTFGGWANLMPELPPAGNPMHANLQKRFTASYQQALAEGVPADRYFAGLFEAQNAGKGTADDTRTIRQPFLLVSRDKVRRVEKEFALATGRLTEAEQLALTGGEQWLNATLDTGTEIVSVGQLVSGHRM